MIPAIVQHAASGEVLMQGFMTREALEKTQTTGQVTFFSRSKQRLWTKGESSGHVLKLVAITTDCDQDSLLIAADPVGPTCHLGNPSCFDGHPLPPLGFLAELEQILASRKGADPATSYTASLYGKGTKRIAQKVGKKGVESGPGRHGERQGRAHQRIRRPALPPHRAAAKRRAGFEGCGAAPL